MKIIGKFFLLAVVVLTTGCATIKLNPKATTQTQFITPADGATAQIIAPVTFQDVVVKQKPSFGTSWNNREFEINVGAPLSSGLLLHVTSQMPATRIGNIDDGKPYDIVLKPSFSKLEFGVEDQKAMLLGAMFGVFAMGANTTIVSNIEISLDIAANGGQPQKISVMGRATEDSAMGTLSEEKLEKVIGASIDDACKKVGVLARDFYQQKIKISSN